ncbi:hypothetical protein PHYBOEH_008740 [Phytophthora boehmeriae]|uniref:Uncharacterized protein n=1 Tax=Phytophthora boehmeriae TaxID=109152 RepID=A0A8T1X0X6_9STRA|nr:hypothetical protein PHYBOEH_008740 [Phytophthora boehmeriae]
MSATASSPPVQEEVQDTGATSPNAQIPPTTSPPQLELSLDDLSQDDKRNDEDETNDASEQKESCEEKESLQRKQEQAACGSADRDAKYMETRLQRNLKQQQAHYARQRRLFEDLRAGRTSTQSECSPDSDSSNASRSSRELSSSPGEGHERLARYCTLPPRKHPMAAMCRLQTVGITNNGSRAHQMVSPTRYRSLSPENDQNDDDDDDSNAQAMLRRIKDKARSEFHRHRLPSEGSPIAVSSSTSHSDRMVKAPAEFLVEMQQQEVSNDALRRQLDLLRRLQLENNRFRQESRTLRERNEILRERDQVREREMKRLRDEATELDARVQRDQTSLASAAQLTHKLKVVQKRLAVAQSENHDLQTALQEARDAFDQLQAESQAKTSDLEMEVKRWKRNTKQLRQEENRTGEEVETYKKTIAALEEDAAKRRSRLKDAKREIIDAKHNIAELSTLIEEKTAHCESIENSAAACVERMSVGMEELQKSLAQECEKHKKAEVTCSTQQMQLERQQAENAMLLDRQKELERQLTLFQEKWKERKQVHHEQLRRQTTQIEEYATRHKKDASTIGQIRKEHEALEAQLAEVKSTASKLKTEVADEARAVQAQVEILRKYVQNASQEQSSSTNTVEDTLLPFESQADSGRSQHEGIWREIPELQVIQGAMSALRNEMMNIVNETQRSRHLMRQQGRKLALALERTEELEHLHAEDAAKIKELREQRMLVEQAREIVSQEKIEVLKWSEQTCAKNESLEAELKKCSQLVFHSQKLLLQALKSDSSWSERDESKAGKTESLRRSFSALEKNVNSLVSQRDHWRLESEKRTREVQEAQTQLSALGRELDAKDNEFKKTLKEIESLHTKHAEEQKLHFEQCIADMDKERTTLTNKLKEESARVAEEEIPTVALIRKRILALGKRVEDLHFQRNSLQKENYEFQFQLEQQATTLSEMAALQKKLASLQEELAALHNENDQKLQRKQVEHEAKNQEVLAKEKELLDAQKKVEILETEVSSLHDEISRTESERVTLQLEVEKLKSLSVEEEEKADTSKAAARRQEEEVKSLKQAVKKAHELYQKVSCQLEKEVQDKAALKTVVEHLKHQHDKRGLFRFDVVFSTYQGKPEFISQPRLLQPESHPSFNNEGKEKDIICAVAGN